MRALALPALLLLASGPAAAHDFKSFKTCTDCVAAGFGWCPIKRMCGGFANDNCGEGERYWREDYDPKAEAKAGKKKKKEKVKDRDLPDVIPLGEKFDYGTYVTKPDGVFVVAFMSADGAEGPGSKAFGPEFAKAAKVLRGVAKCGEVNGAAAGAPALDGVSYPHVVVYLDDKKASAPVKYGGALNAKDLVAFVKEEVKALLQKRTGMTIEEAAPKEPEPEPEPEPEAAEVEKTPAAEEEPAAEAPGAEEAKKDKKKKKKKKGKKKGKKGKKAKAEEEGGVKGFRPGTGDNVNGLPDADAFQALLGTEHVALIHVYDPKSETCSNIAQAFDEAATATRGQAVYYGTQETLDGKYAAGNVYIKSPGKQAEAVKFTGDATASGFEKAVAELLPAVEVPELVDQATFDACLAKPLCGVAFVPSLTVTGADGRKALIEKAKTAAGLARTAGAMLWAEAGSQPAIAHKFDLMNPNTLLLFKGKRRKAAVHALEADTMAAIIVEAFMSEKPPAASYRPFLIAPRAPWNGKDFEYPKAA